MGRQQGATEQTNPQNEFLHKIQHVQCRRRLARSVVPDWPFIGFSMCQPLLFKQHQTAFRFHELHALGATTSCYPTPFGRTWGSGPGHGPVLEPPGALGAQEVSHLPLASRLKSKKGQGTASCAALSGCNFVQPFHPLPGLRQINAHV